MTSVSDSCVNFSIRPIFRRVLAILVIFPIVYFCFDRPTTITNTANSNSTAVSTIVNPPIDDGLSRELFVASILPVIQLIRFARVPPRPFSPLWYLLGMFLAGGLLWGMCSYCHRVPGWVDSALALDDFVICGASCLVAVVALYYALCYLFPPAFALLVLAFGIVGCIVAYLPASLPRSAHVLCSLVAFLIPLLKNTWTVNSFSQVKNYAFDVLWSMVGLYVFYVMALHTNHVTPALRLLAVEFGGKCQDHIPSVFSICLVCLLGFLGVGVAEPVARP